MSDGDQDNVYNAYCTKYLYLVHHLLVSEVVWSPHGCQVEPLYQPKQLQLDTFNLHEISGTRGHIPVHFCESGCFAHDNSCVLE